MPRTMTEDEIRNYLQDGHPDRIVKIAQDGKVDYRDGDGEWLDGRWAEEYVVEDDGVMRIK